MTALSRIKLLKNIQFHDESRSIQAYIKKRLSNSDLEVIMSCIDLIIAPNHLRIIAKSPVNLRYCGAVILNAKKILRKDRNFKPENVKKYLMLYYNK